MTDCTGGDVPGDGDCTVVGGCSGCSGCGGCSGSTPAPVLPRCQDVSLTPGVFANATITVNSAGCISLVEEGEAEVYTPDECCGSEGSGGGSAGARGPKGDPGTAATISVEEVIGTGATWSVENVGTTSAAIFKFTAPAASTGGTGGSGTTGDVAGLVVNNGSVVMLPESLVTKVEAIEQGFHADKFEFKKVLQILPEEITLSLNIDLLVDYINAADNAADLRLDNLEALTAVHSGQIAALSNAITAINGTLTTMNATLTALDARITALESAGSSGGTNQGGG